MAKVYVLSVVAGSVVAVGLPALRSPLEDESVRNGKNALRGEISQEFGISCRSAVVCCRRLITSEHSSG